MISDFVRILEAQLLYLTRVSLIDSLTDNLTFSCFGHISIACESIWTFFRLEFKKEAISDGGKSENSGIGGGFWILSYFRELINPLLFYFLTSYLGGISKTRGQTANLRSNQHDLVLNKMGR